MSARPGQLRMSDLCRESGLDRQAIHFYIREGLLPPGEKAGRNMAFYKPSHLKRLRLIRKLQHERFLPLKAIKGVLDQTDEGFSDEQRAFLADLRGRMAGELAPRAQADGEVIPLGPLLERTGVSEADFEQMVALGFVAAMPTTDGAPGVPAAEAWRVESWGRLRAAGFTEALGFGVEDVAIYEGFVDRLIQAEAGLISARLGALDPAEAAPMIEAALPIIQELLVRLHTERSRAFLSEL
ncbi:MAG: MerR family transcriptional regulator [Deltaproteobacteria bacterium]|nr:MerR family transcriptional regulator [Deltaproteobacteria bacterium]